MGEEARSLVENLTTDARDIFSQQREEDREVRTSAELYSFSKQAREIIVRQGIFVARCLRLLLHLNAKDREHEVTFRVGIIGCGTVGSQLAAGLLDTGLFTANDIIVVTRKNAGQKHFGSAGVRFERFRHCRLVFLTCLPAHIETVAKTLRGKFRPNALLCSVVKGLATERIRKLFQTRFVTRSHLQQRWIATGQRLEHLEGELLGKGHIAGGHESISTRAAALHLSADPDSIFELMSTFEMLQESLEGRTVFQEGENGKELRNGADSMTRVSLALFGTDKEALLEGDKSENMSGSSSSKETMATRALRRRFVEHFWKLSIQS